MQLTQVPANGNRTFFLDIAQLRGVETVGLECFTSTSMTYSPNGNTMVPTSRGLVLTLAVQSLEEFVQIPLWTLESAQNAGIIRELARKKINLVKSYVTMVDATLYATGQSVCFNFYYNKPVGV